MPEITLICFDIITGTDGGYSISVLDQVYFPGCADRATNNEINDNETIPLVSIRPQGVFFTAVSVLFGDACQTTYRTVSKMHNKQMTKL